MTTLAIALPEENLRRIHAELEAAIEAAKVPVQTIRELGGPNPGIIGSQLRTRIEQGTGYLREARDLIAAMFRKKNTLMKKELAEESEDEV